VAQLTKLINDVYVVAETGIFNDAYQRTYADEVRNQLRERQLALATLNDSASGTDTSSSAAGLVGCIRVVKLSAAEGELGTLVAAPETRGSGLGKRLVDFAEDEARSWGATVMQLELLVPTTFRHEVKSWLQPWYERLGYKLVRAEDFALSYPKLAPLTITQVEYRVFLKDLYS
jgi:GNAT superfamily N-acetyltransferase